MISFLAVAAFAAMTVAGDPGLTVSSTAFTANSNIPAKYSCEGGESSPPLMVDNLPATTKSLALIVHDPDATMPGGFTHWVVFNIEPTNNNIAENYKDAVQGLNGAKQNGYKGMCPPTGTHHYHFMVYALDSKIDADAKTDKASLEAKMKGHILAQGELVGLYKKSNQ